MSINSPSTLNAICSVSYVCVCTLLCVDADVIYALNFWVVVAFMVETLQSLAMSSCQETLAAC